MPDCRRVALEEESELGTFAVRRGGATLALGAGALVCAVVGVVAGRHWLGAPTHLLLLFVAPLIALGAGWLVVGARAVAGEGRRRRQLASRPEAPWLADHPWSPPVVSDRAGAQLAALTARLAMGLACGAPLALGLWLADETELAVVLGILTLAAGAIGIGYTAHRAARWLRQGTSRLELSGFPVAPGGVLRATYRPGRPVATSGPVHARLRFIVERYERSGVGRSADVDVVCYRCYEDRRELPLSGRVLDPATGAGIELPVPAVLDRDWVTRLSSRPARYWQLVVEAECPGPDLRAAFFIPVYAPAGGGAHARPDR